MWLVASYEPTTLFSLRYSSATTAGAKSLLVPSPYTIKMALLVAAIRIEGKEWARANFIWIRGLTPLRLRPPQYAVVNRCFLRFQKKAEEKTGKEKRDPNKPPPIGYGPPTVGFREYVHLQGALDIAFPVENLTDEQRAHLCRLLMQVNTFGKRGSLFQFLGCDERAELSDDFSQVFHPGATSVNGLLQPLDDMAPGLTFEKVDVTDTAKMNKTDRPTQTTLLPLQARRFAASWASYERIRIS